MLKSRIETLRRDLEKAASENAVLSAEEVVKVSQELDKLIELYHRSIYTNHQKES